MKALYCFLVLLLSACGRSATGVKVPTGWIATSPAPAESEAAMCANAARDEWAVQLTSDSTALTIRPAADERMADTLRVADGQFVGENRGEFGGDVWWVPTNGTREHVASANLHAFLQTRDTVFGLIGLAHLSLNTGQLVRFDRIAGHWRMTPIGELGAAPETFVPLSHDSLLVLAVGRVIRVSPTHTIAVMRTNPVWLYTYPRSIARDRHGVIYLGMRSGVARLTPSAAGYAEDWLVPTACRHRVPTGPLGECRCEA